MPAEEETYINIDCLDEQTGEVLPLCKEEKHKVSPEELENKLLIEELLQQLSGREQQLIKMRYFENATQSQIAAKLGTSQVQVSRMEKKILLQMRKYMSQGWQTKGVEIY